MLTLGYLVHPSLFTDLNLSTSLTSNLDSLGYQKMTEVQAQTLPLIIKGDDVIAQAKTGSGKTAAFGLGLLNNLDVKRFRIQALVICPTRELANQVANEIRKLARTVHNIKVLTLCGASPIGPQIGSLEHGAHIIVGTPGRLSDHLRKQTLDLSNVHTLVLDEADRMLDMGFYEQIEDILEQTPSTRQTLLFSATYPENDKNKHGLSAISERFLKQPHFVKIEHKEQHQNIEQHFYEVEGKRGRFDALTTLLANESPEAAIVFCDTKRDCQSVCDQLDDAGFSANALHGDMEQRDRHETLIKFSNRSVRILVATDVAARGLDIDKVDAVFVYHLSKDSDIHTHRVGRTGRADHKGKAFTFYESNESFKLKFIEESLNAAIIPEIVPSRVRGLSNVTAKMVSIQILGGKKQKLRAGDILGALTSDKHTRAIQGSSVGKINVMDQISYVAIEKEHAHRALECILQGRMKGKQFRARLV